ncbi:methionyl-tRNA formyltransferase [Vitreoscilla massiliensis]|uniref:Methionyl-tRNA formyltransferase n=1 Tax=Vitreoscilla massiliensis TaxID=1689272 RepID=A0ABY4EBQ9_9NEIS|nr:methionyl-tRNA formyltransferase [Vitreoscilla massiliensis]UOO90837.1 methionyl-tRNA formyltransferase [Vitreoscilla massiliensis]
MKIVFAGTPDFAASALAAILAAGHEVLAVLTQPDRPKGRGMKLTPSPVKTLALQHGLPVWQPEHLKDADTQQQLRDLQADVMVVAAYGLLLPAAVLNIPTYGCLNIHASLLPRWRGAAPIQRAIEAGDKESGVCIMQMDVGLDTGDVLLIRRTPITDTTTAAQLHDDLALLGADAIVAALADLTTLIKVPQPEAGVTYAQKLSKADAQIDWSLSAEHIHNKVRALNPVPGAWTSLQGNVIKVWASTMVNTQTQGHIGQIIAADKHGITVQTGAGAILLTELQASGSKRMAASAFVAGHSDLLAQQFERLA